MKKISICTVCMNRLTFLRETLPVNIQENIGYPELEFVLLDYNSKDGLQDWVKDNMSDYIGSGLLKYYRTTEPQYFSAAHSKNIACKMASGDIICMVDADNFAGPGYASWIADAFSTPGIDAIATTIRKDFIPYRDQGGKMAYSAGLFHTAKGFDECLRSYGMDDVDLVNRLEKAGGTRLYIEREEFLRFIGHSHAERIINFPFGQKILSVYLPFGVEETPMSEMSTVPVLYLFNDGTFHEHDYDFDFDRQLEYVTVFGGWSLTNDRCKDGKYRHTDTGMALEFDEGGGIFYDLQADGRLVSRDPDHRIIMKEVTREDELYGAAMMAYGEVYNRMIYVQNDNNDKLVNPEGWGKGVVYRNFDTAHPISLT